MSKANNLIASYLKGDQILALFPQIYLGYTNTSKDHE